VAHKVLLLCCLLALVVCPPSLAEPVVIQNVPAIGWIAGRFSYHISALQAALQAMGCDATYEHLMVTSGAGFRAAWPTPTGYDYSVTCIWPPGEDYLTNGARAVGAKAVRDMFGSHEEAWGAICASIDQGRPVVAWEGCGAQVICGYDAQRKQLHVQSCNAGDRKYQVVPLSALAMAPPPLPQALECVFLEYDPNTPRPEFDWPTILARAVRFADYPATPGLFGRYAFGLAAYDAWAASLRGGADKAGARVDAAITETVANTLSNARTAVSTVLREFATLHDAFPVAAEHYSAEALILKSIPKALAGGQDSLPWEARLDAMAESFATRGERETVAQLVEQAKAEERQAVDALRQALKDLAPPKPEPPPAEPPRDQTNAAEEHYQHGVELKRAGQLADAATELRAAIAADPKHVKAHYALAWVLLDQKDKDGATAEFKKVLELAPDSDEGKEAKKALERIGQP